MGCAELDLIADILSRSVPLPVAIAGPGVGLGDGEVIDVERLLRPLDVDDHGAPAVVAAVEANAGVRLAHVAAAPLAFVDLSA